MILCPSILTLYYFFNAVEAAKDLFGHSILQHFFLHFLMKQFNFGGGGGGRMHQSASNAKKQNKQFLTMLYEQEKQKLTTPTSKKKKKKKPHPFPKEFYLLTCALKKAQVQFQP